VEFAFCKVIQKESVLGNVKISQQYQTSNQVPNPAHCVYGIRSITKFVVKFLFP